MSTLAEYNNNPGNLRPAKGVKYEGMIGVDENGFAVFETPKFGEQALINDLTHKLEKRGISTPSAFVDMYSPASAENSEEARDNYKIYIAHKLGLKGTNEPFPKNAVPLLTKAVTNFEGGKWQEDLNAKTSENAEANPNVKTIDAPKTVNADLLEPPANITGSAPYAVIGGYGGAKIAGGIESGKKVLPILHNWYDKATKSDAWMFRQQSKGSLQRYLNSQIEPDLRLPLSELEKVGFDGKPIRTPSEVQDALANIKEVPEQKITKTVYKPSVSGGQSLVDTGKVIPRTIPGRPAVDLSAYKYTPTFATKVVDEAKNAGEMVKGALPSAGRVGVGIMGGALAGSQLYDAVNQYNADGKDWHLPTLRNAAQFASGAGGALSTLPFGVTQAAGLALQAPELAYQGYEGLQELNKRRKQATREDVNRMLTEVDPMGNPLQQSRWCVSTREGKQLPL